MLLLRSPKQKPPRLWAARCTLPPEVANTTAAPRVPEEATFSCKSGTGAYEFEQPSAALAGGGESPTQPATTRWCEWSVPAVTNIPDAPSRTCAGRLPRGGGVGLVGNQGSLYPAGTFPANPAAQASRDPLTFLASSDGLHFDRHWVVREGAPTPKWQVEAGGLPPAPSPPPTHTLHALPRAALCSPSCQMTPRRP